MAYLFTGDTRPLGRREAVPLRARNRLCYESAPTVLCADQELRAVLWVPKHAGASAATVDTPCSDRRTTHLIRDS
jgi:hypothetical protein